MAIDAACDAVRTITEQDFNAQTGTAVLDGTGTDALILRKLPVTSIQSVTIGGTVTSGTLAGGTQVTNWMLRGDGVLLRTAGAAVASGAETLPLRWPVGRQNVSVVYSSGYGTAVLPRDVRRIALDYAAREVVQGDAVSEQVGDVNIRYGGPASDFTDGELRILRKYRP